MRLWHLELLLFLTVGSLPFPSFTAAQDRTSFQALNLSEPLALDQLEIIKRLHERDPNLAIGVEYFQQPFQKQVDDYIEGRTPESEFLRATEYYQRWGYDYRLYAPIFRYARDQRIPVRALNVPTALTSAVAKVGIAGLSEQQRAYLPRQIEP